MELEGLRRYWPVVLVAGCVGFFGYRLRPQNSASKLALGALTPADFAELKPEVSEKESDPKQGALDPNKQRATASTNRDAFEVDDTRYQLIEVPIILPAEEAGGPVRTFTQDSPEVKQALLGIKIEIYGPEDANDTKMAREFFSHNHLVAQEHDTVDVMELERARRLGGDAEKTVIVIDGEVTVGYSQKDVQELLARAAKKRIDP